MHIVKTSTLLCLCAPALCLCTTAIAQPIPAFIGGAVTAFDVEIGIIDSGTLLDAQAVVSNDRRYVTINARASNSSLLALQSYNVNGAVAGASGFVGGIDPDGKVAGADAKQLPSQIDQADKNATSILSQRGVHLLSSLK